MEMEANGSEELLFGRVALARFRISDSAPPMPRSRWMKTTWGMVGGSIHAGCVNLLPL